MVAGIPQTTVSSCTPTATGRSIAKRWMWHHRVPQGAFARLELLEGKRSRAVLSTTANLPRQKPTAGCPPWRRDRRHMGISEQRTVERFAVVLGDFFKRTS